MKNDILDETGKGDWNMVCRVQKMAVATEYFQ